MISTQALLLRSAPYRDADLVVELLTAGGERVAALARGARKSRRRFGGMLAYFNLLHVQLKRRPGGLGRLDGVELVTSWEVLSQDVDAYFTGSYLLELAQLGTREGDASGNWFALLLGGLDGLQRGAQPASLARVFQVQALAQLGYAPVARHCPECGRALEREAVATAWGAVVCRSCAGPSAPSLSMGALRTLQTAAELAPERVGSLRFTGALAAELVPFLDVALERALGRRPLSLASLPGFEDR